MHSKLICFFFYLSSLSSWIGAQSIKISYFILRSLTSNILFISLRCGIITTILINKNKILILILKNKIVFHFIKKKNYPYHLRQIIGIFPWWFLDLFGPSSSIRSVTTTTTSLAVPLQIKQHTHRYVRSSDQSSFKIQDHSNFSSQLLYLLHDSLCRVLILCG
jgi:hypothetical protein